MRVTGTGASVAGAILAGALQQVAPDVMAKIHRDDSVMKRLCEVQVGEYTGTGAALDVPLEFDPIFVFVYNLTDGDTAGFAFNTTNVGTKSGTIVLATAQEAAQGILFAAAGTKKFSLGTAATLNETGKTFQYVAFGA